LCRAERLFADEKHTLEALLETERAKFQELLITSTDRVFEAMKLTPVSYAVKEAAAAIAPDAPDISPIAALSTTQRDYYDDSRAAFMQYEMTNNKRSKAEAEAIWNADFSEDAAQTARIMA